ncbi:hypothetical protein [Aurantiacibacter luteus]|nr:hypothetical protein [Aurantiacibacter luteus]
MIFVYGIGAALVVLGFWAFVLWLGARADQKHLDREKALRTLSEGKTDGR